MLLRRFGARARGGISPAEASRRHEAALAAKTSAAQQRELPPSLIAERLGGTVHPLSIPERTEVVDPEAKPPEAADGEPAVDVANPAADTGEAGGSPAPFHRAPVVTVTISGPDGTSTITHLIRAALAHEGIPFEGPARLRPMRWQRALDRHFARGLRVVVVREQIAAAELGEAAE